MNRAGETVWLLCNDNLHPFEVAVAAVDFECPQCGCKYGRLDPRGGDTKAIAVIDVKEPYAVPGVDSWVQKLPIKEKVEATIPEGN